MLEANFREEKAADSKLTQVAEARDGRVQERTGPTIAGVPAPHMLHKRISDVGTFYGTNRAPHRCRRAV